MTIGPITIRLTKAVEAEQHEAESTARVQRRRIILLAAELVKLKTVLHKWGLDEGLCDGGASEKAKTPKGAGVSI